MTGTVRAASVLNAIRHTPQWLSAGKVESLEARKKDELELVPISWPRSSYHSRVHEIWASSLLMLSPLGAIIPEGRLQAAAIKLLHAVDQRLSRIPGVRWLAWQAIWVLRKPAGDQA